MDTELINVVTVLNNVSFSVYMMLCVVPIQCGLISSNEHVLIPNEWRQWSNCYQIRNNEASMRACVLVWHIRTVRCTLEWNGCVRGAPPTNTQAGVIGLAWVYMMECRTLAARAFAMDQAMWCGIETSQRTSKCGVEHNSLPLLKLYFVIHVTKVWLCFSVLQA